MRLVDVYDVEIGTTYLFDLLKERKKDESISHKKMPLWKDHVAFVDSKPYKYWYLIVDDCVVGSIYLTKRNEVGMSIFRLFRRHGYASEALTMFRRKHKGKLYANINPNNHASIAFFKKRRFTPLQVTYVSA